MTLCSVSSDSPKRKTDMASEPVTLRGVILTSREYKEKDRVLKFLTKERGLLDIYVKGTGKMNSSNAFISVPYMLCDITVSDSHGYLYFRSGNIIESNSRIMTDLDTITAAAHFADILIDTSGQSENFKEAYELAVYAYYYLASSAGRYMQFVAAFNWRILSILGFTVIYEVTNDTRLPVTGDGVYYVSNSGGDIYAGRKEGDYSVLSGVAVKALNYMASCDIKDLFAMTCSDSMVSSLSDFTLRYISYHFEKNYKERFEL